VRRGETLWAGDYDPRTVRRLLVLAALLVVAAPAHAHRGETAPTARTAAVEEPCGGDPIAPSRVVTGTFSSSLAGSYVMLPFTVPDGTTALRVKYCFDQPDAPTSAAARHTLDLGLWGPNRFRGWGGSSHPDVTVSAQGFSSEEQYRSAPRGHVPGRTTRGFLPGRVKDGRWFVELGAMAIVGRELGDSDGAVGWRVEIELSSDPAFARSRYEPARYRTRTARRGPGWYAGDLHVHAEHSALGDATMRETFDYAFGPAKLDFVTLSDYVTTSAWGEIGRHQPRYPDRLIARSSEVITPQGHANNHVSRRYVDHRTGPVHLLRADGTLALMRPARPASRIFDAIHRGRGIAQINHPTIFPSSVPGFALQCRGCPWDHDPASTDYSKVDAIEVSTGPAGIQDAQGLFLGPNPFTPLAIAFYDDALARGGHIAAVGSSDSHKAGRRDNPVTQAPIGMATTMVHARSLSENGIRCGIARGHTYVKLWGADGPSLSLEATVAGAAGTAIFGDTVRGERASFVARVREGAPGMLLQVVRNGEPYAAHALTAAALETRWQAGPGRYRLQLMRGSSIEAVSTPIWVEPGPPAILTQPCP
jgi:hypothetical protein